MKTPQIKALPGITPLGTSRQEFSVVQFFNNDTYERVRSYVSIQEALRAAQHYTTSVGAKAGIVERVIITDGGDSIVFQWERDHGITWPIEQANEGLEQ